MLLFLIWITLTTVAADFECLCNYHVERTLYNQADLQAGVAGYLYEFDCKPTFQMALQQGWKAIVNEQKVVYIQLDPMTKVQTCPGNPSPLDIITTPDTLSQTTTTAVPSTPVSTTAMPSTRAPTAPVFTTRTTTTPVPTTPVPTTRAPTTPVPTTTAPTTPVPTLLPTTSSVIQGQTSLCPDPIKNAAARDHSLLAQYGNSCYEFYKEPVPWSRMEVSCKVREGHIVSIEDAAEQEFIHKTMLQHNLHKSYWLGLHDDVYEGQFQWASGAPVTYTNWKPNRETISQNVEDCVVMSDTGLWDDVPCGQSLFAVIHIGEKHGGICETKINGKHGLPDLSFHDLIGK